MSEHRTPAMDRVDTAIAQRLRQLSARPVDTSRLDRRLEGGWGDAEPAERPIARFRPRWRGLTRAAAVVTLLVLAGFWTILGEGPAVASPSALAQLHHQSVTQPHAMAAVTTIAAANEHIARQWADAPAVPHAAGASVASCCLGQLDGVPVASVRLEWQGQPVTLVVAHGSQIASPEGSRVRRGGRTYTVHREGELAMAMTRAGDRWLCEMGQLDRQQLLEVAGQIRF